MDASIIGRGAVIRGSVRGEGDLEIQGRVEGSVVIGGELSIAEGAVVQSDVSARRVVVHGAVAGNVSANEAIVLEAGARVVGDLGAPQIGIRAGALVRGNVSTAGPLPDGGLAKAAPARAQKPAPAARPAPAPAARPAARPAPAARSTEPRAPSARPAPVRPAPRVEPPSAPRVEAPPPPASSPALASEDDEAGELLDEEAAAAEAGALGDEEGGPPPPVVPTIRKGAKASLRRKGAR